MSEVGPPCSKFPRYDFIKLGEIWTHRVPVDDTLPGIRLDENRFLAVVHDVKSGRWFLRSYVKKMGFFIPTSEWREYKDPKNAVLKGKFSKFVRKEEIDEVLDYFSIGSTLMFDERISWFKNRERVDFEREVEEI